MDRRLLIVPLALLAPACLAAQSQDVFRCTSATGRVTYQQARCPSADEERRVDVSPANPAVDPTERERLLKQGEELDRRLEARAAAERAERKEREERDARERMAQAREQRAAPVEPMIYVVPGWWRPAYRQPAQSLTAPRRQTRDNKP
jgi:hypothetical protein